MFDTKGLIKNDYVDYATSEIALNLDTVFGRLPILSNKTLG